MLDTARGPWICVDESEECEVILSLSDGDALKDARFQEGADGAAGEGESFKLVKGQEGGYHADEFWREGLHGADHLGNELPGKLKKV